jgi:flavodoxin
MKYCIVYWSRFGNGKKIVGYIEKKLTENKQEVQMFQTNDVNPSSMPDADIYIFSAPVEAFRVQTNMRKLMKKLEGMDGKKYGIINTHAMKNRNGLSSMEKMLSKKNMEKINEIHFQMAKGHDKGNGLMEGWEQNLDEFIKTLH